MICCMTTTCNCFVACYHGHSLNHYTNLHTVLSYIVSPISPVHCLVLDNYLYCSSVSLFWFLRCPFCIFRINLACSLCIFISSFHHSQHPSLLHCFMLALKHTFPQILRLLAIGLLFVFHVRPLFLFTSFFVNFWTRKRVTKSHSSLFSCCSIKILKAFLICSGAQRNFAHTFVLTCPQKTDLPSQILKLISYLMSN